MREARQEGEKRGAERKVRWKMKERGGGGEMRGAGGVRSGRRR